MPRKLSVLLITCLVACLSTGCGKSDKKDVRATSGEQKTELTGKSAEKPDSAIQDKISIADVQKFAVPQEFRKPGFGLSFKVTNNTDKAISGVQLSIIVKSQFDDELRRLKCDIDKDIPANGSILFNADRRGSWETNQFMADDVRALETPAEKLKFDFIVNKIVYKDGSVDKM